MNKIIFDIETLGRDWEDFDDEQKKYFTKFCESEEDLVKAKEQLALQAMTAEVVCIGMLNPQTNQGACYYRGDNGGDNDNNPKDVINVVTKDDKQELVEDGIMYKAGSEIEIIEWF